jgi:ABC-type glycerol-3-phosphate transport system permease component
MKHSGAYSLEALEVLHCKQRRRRRLHLFLQIVVFALLFLLTMTPIVWGVITSFKAEREVVAYPPKLWGFTPVLSNYTELFVSGYMRTFLNSILYALSSIVLGLFLGMMAAYGLQRHRFPGRKLLFYLVIAGIPLSAGSAVLLIPNYMYFSLLGLTNRMLSLTILYAAYNLPMAIWIMRGGLENIPIEIEEAASIDGCSRAYILFNLIPSLNRPAMAFYPTDELNDDPTNWWAPNVPAMQGMLGCVGFERVETVTPARNAVYRGARAVYHRLRGKNKMSPAFRQDRAVFHARKRRIPNP